MLETSRPANQNLINAFSTRKNDFDFSFLYTTSFLSAKEVTCNIKLIKAVNVRKLRTVSQFVTCQENSVFQACNWYPDYSLMYYEEK